MDNKEQIIDECIKIINKFIISNCNDHTPYKGPCCSCGRSDNFELIRDPDELIKELEKLK